MITLESLLRLTPYNATSGRAVKFKMLVILKSLKMKVVNEYSLHLEDERLIS